MANDNYPYGIYHPWKQKTWVGMNYTVIIYFKIKTGVDSLGNPTYRNLSKIEKASTIMGVFDSNNTS